VSLISKLIMVLSSNFERCVEILGKYIGEAFPEHKADAISGSEWSSYMLRMIIPTVAR
jgi:hypothetical protein